MSTATIIAIGLAALGMLLIWRGLHHLRRQHALLHGCGLCLFGLLPIMLGVLMLLFASALKGYHLLD